MKPKQQYVGLHYQEIQARLRAAGRPNLLYASLVTLVADVTCPRGFLIDDNAALAARLDMSPNELSQRLVPLVDAGLIRINKKNNRCQITNPRPLFVQPRNRPRSLPQGSLHATRRKSPYSHG